jgi:hypothetical protein
MRDTITSAAGSVVGQARAAFQDAADAAKAVVQDAGGKTADAAGSGAAAATEMAHGAKNMAKDIAKDAAAAATRSRNALTGFANDNALLVAGIAAAVGAFIAASIPASDAENRLFGAGSAKLKDKAREAAAQGIETAGEIASQAAGSVAAAAAREGLDASGVQRALNKVADSVRTVADRGLETALGANSQPIQQNTSERNAS